MPNDASEDSLIRTAVEEGELPQLTIPPDAILAFQGYFAGRMETYGFASLGRDGQLTYDFASAYPK